MLRDIGFILLGYLSGSVLYALILGNLISKINITEGTSDQNPGTANAFKKGGFLCGCFTLFCDIMKGFLPVFLYCSGQMTFALIFVLSAPVVGHAFPIFHKFRGGKGIAVTFGCLFGLLPDHLPLAALAFWYIFFVLVVNIKSNYHKTFAAYILTEITLIALTALNRVPITFLIGFSIICTTVIIRLIKSTEKKEPIEVKLLWMHL